ncbi:MAG: hypothetical protein Q9Q13_01270 [Acidobacteriota bacterium]|nr:hypothetical protein [Acidobacteriota bacterium]
MNNVPFFRRLALIASIVLLTLVAAGLSAGARNWLERGDSASVTLPTEGLARPADFASR